MNTEATLRAWHNDPALKARIMARLDHHIALDQMVQGVYTRRDPRSREFRGCTIGCVLHTSNHGLFPVKLGVPAPIAYLIDGIFEGLSASNARVFGRDVWEAIPVGVDLSLVGARMKLWILDNDKWGTRNLVTDDALEETDTMIALFSRQIEGEIASASEWETLKDKIAQHVDVRAWAESAVDELLESTQYAILSAVKVASQAWIESGINAEPRDDYYRALAAELIRVLANAPTEPR